MALKAGTRKKGATGYEDQYKDSMAAAIEHAFMKEWPLIMGSDAPAPNDHMRLLFIAIAQGVVKHLKTNASSISVTVPGVGTVQATINTDNTVLH